MKNVKIAVTGATGLVGSHVSEYLARNGYTVRAIVRSSVNAKPFLNQWQQLHIEMRPADILNADQLQHALSGIDVIIHAAGIVDPYASADEITAVNVTGSELVLKTAVQLNIQQCIFISSLSVITGNCDQYNATENSPLVLCGEAYADSKVQAEQIVTSVSYKNKIAVTVLRPGFIYGPRERAWLPQLIQAIANGKAVLIDQGSKETNVIYIENLCRAVEAAILNTKAYGQIYNLTDGEHITKKELFDAISDGLNLPHVNKNLPSWLIKPIFGILSKLISNMPIEKRKQFSRFSQAAYRLIGINQGFSISKAQSDLNYTHPISFATGMGETLNYFKKTLQSETLVKTEHDECQSRR